MPAFQRPTGTLDRLPEDQPYWDHIRTRARHLAQLSGFQRIDVPVFEATELFARGIGAGTDVVDKEMYTFTDKGDHQLTLRPEFTAGVMRAYIENGLRVRSQPQKLYSIGPVFRYERPQAGRYRQHTQFNIEILGEQEPAADLEIMTLTWDLYSGLGFKDLEFQLNSVGCPRCRPQYVAALEAHYGEHLAVICEDCHRRLERNPLRVLDCKDRRCQTVIAEAPRFLNYLCEECAEHFGALREYLDMLDRRYIINHRLVRGLDYYTKTVFEVWASGIGAQAAVCGGGRYDGLAALLGGVPTPGVGVAVGLERIILAMKSLGVEPPPLSGPKVFLAHMGRQPKREVLRQAAKLRAAGIAVWVPFGDRGLRSQLREAGKRGATYVAILGEDELASHLVIVKDMSTGEQVEVLFEDLIEWLQKRP